MKKYNQLTFSERIQWRIRGLWCVLVMMLVYMVIVGEIGGDPRIITTFADGVGRIIFFGGMGYIVHRIMQNKKILKNQMLLKEQLKTELDERNQYLHDKSGGVVWDILFIVLLCVTLTTSLFNMPAFYTSFSILIIAVALKLVAYSLYSKYE